MSVDTTCLEFEAGTAMEAAKTNPIELCTGIVVDSRELLVAVGAVGSSCNWNSFVCLPRTKRAIIDGAMVTVKL